MGESRRACEAGVRRGGRACRAPRWLFLGFAMSGALLCAERPSRAHDVANSRATLAFEGPLVCGGAESFVRRSERHGARGLRIGEDATLRVVVTRRTSGFTGYLESKRGPSGGVRRVDGATCDAVLEAMALLVAMVLDAETREPILAEPAPERPPASPTGAPAAEPVVDSSAATHAEEAIEPTQVIVDRSSFGVFAGIAGVVAVLDESNLRGAEVSGAWLPVRADRWLGTAEVTAFGRWGERSFANAARVDLARFGASVRGCLVRGLPAELFVDLCGALELGAHLVRPQGFTSSDGGELPWVALAFLPRLRWALGDQVAATLALEMSVPLNARIYMGEVEGSGPQQVYRAAVGAVGANFGLLWRIL